MFGFVGDVLGGLTKSIGGFLKDPLGQGSIQAGMDAQAQTTRDSNALLEKIYDQQRADTEPWRQAGLGALADLGDADFKRDFTLSDFQKDPGYDFRMQEGQKAIERSAAARGGLQGGAALKALTRYGQDYASNEYTNAYNRFNADRDRRFNRLSSIAGLGQTANGQVLNAAGNFGSMYSQNTTGLGNAIAAGNLAKANSNQMLIKGGLTALAGA